MANPKPNLCNEDFLSNPVSNNSATASIIANEVTDPNHDQSTVDANRGIAYIGGVPVDMNFIRSRSGLLHIVKILLCLIIAVCAGTATSSCKRNCGSDQRMVNVAVADLIFSVFLLIIFAVHNLKEIIGFIHWPGTEFLHNIIFTVTYFVGCCLVAAHASWEDAEIATTIFGFVAVLPYAYATYLSYLVCRELYINNNSKSTNTTLTTTRNIVNAP